MSSVLLQFPKNPKVEPNWRAGALKGGTFLDFLTSIVVKHQKIEGAPFGDFLGKKSHIAEKTEKGDRLVSPGTVCYAEKHKKKPFRFSSLSQMVQFDTLIFRRTFCNFCIEQLF